MTTTLSNKTAQTKHNVNELIKKRWSPRAFSNQAIEDEKMKELLEASSWAPSAMNEQPWRYFYAHKNDEAFNRLVDCLLPMNQLWAKKAAVIIASCASIVYEKTQAANKVALYDTGAANANMLTQAISQDIYGHVIGGFDPEKTKETLGLSENLVPVCFIALGYLGNADDLPEGYKERELAERTRKSIDEFSTRLAL